MRKHEVSVPRATLAWLVDLAEGAYVDGSGTLSRQQEMDFRVHVSIAHQSLGTDGQFVPEPRKAT